MLKLILDHFGFETEYVLAKKNDNSAYDNRMVLSDLRRGEIPSADLDTIAVMVKLEDEEYFLDATGGNFTPLVLGPDITRKLLDNPNSQIEYDLAGQTRRFYFHRVDQEIVDLFLDIREGISTAVGAHLANDPGLYIKDKWRVAFHFEEPNQDEMLSLVSAADVHLSDDMDDNKHSSDFRDSVGQEIYEGIKQAYKTLKNYYSNGRISITKLEMSTDQTNRVIINKEDI
jgi:hypothetical protein